MCSLLVIKAEIGTADKLFLNQKENVCDAEMINRLINRKKNDWQ